MLCARHYSSEVHTVALNHLCNCRQLLNTVTLVLTWYRRAYGSTHTVMLDEGDVHTVARVGIGEVAHIRVGSCAVSKGAYYGSTSIEGRVYAIHARKLYI